MIFLNFNLCIRLERIGIKNPSGFYYQKNGSRKDKIVYSSREICIGMTNFDSVYAPAYTSHDLDEALPAEITLGGTFNFVIRKNGAKYEARYEDSNGRVVRREYSPSPVEARARLIIYLNRKGMI